LIFGLNQSTISSGSIATVQFAISSGAASGAVPISISNIVASDASANSVSASGTSGSITVQAAADATPPTISSVAVSGITSTTATITWSTNELSDTRVSYGTTIGYGSNTNSGTLVTAHSQQLTGLASQTAYHYRVLSADATGNLATSSDYTFTTLDIVAPTISNVTATGITSSSATIAWTTNEAASTQVEYGTTTSYGSSTTLNGSLVTSHLQSLSGLASGTTYHYRAKSSDTAGNPTTSNDYTFTTSAAADTTAPTISSVTATGITSSSATIAWTTNEAASTRVEYGTTTS
jgi:type VI protein secretion system component Hcp